MTVSSSAPVVSAPVVTVIAIGNPYRGDDAVGAAVIALVGELLGHDPRVRLAELDGEPVRMMQAWEGSSTVWIVVGVIAFVAIAVTAILAARRRR